MKVLRSSALRIGRLYLHWAGVDFFGQEKNLASCSTWNPEWPSRSLVAILTAPKPTYLSSWSLVELIPRRRSTTWLCEFSSQPAFSSLRCRVTGSYARDNGRCNLKFHTVGTKGCHWMLLWSITPKFTDS